MTFQEIAVYKLQFRDSMYCKQRDKKYQKDEALKWIDLFSRDIPLSKHSNIQFPQKSFVCREQN